MEAKPMKWPTHWLTQWTILGALGLLLALPILAAAQEATVQREVKGKPGWYEAVAWLRPHFQLETLTTSMRLVAEVPKKA